MYTTMSPLPRLLVTLFLWKAVMCERLLSLNKSIRSSSTYTDPYHNWDPRNAVDGNYTNTPNTCKCCASTGKDHSPWYELDLGGEFLVERINVVGRAISEVREHNLDGTEIFLAPQSKINNVTAEAKVTGERHSFHFTMPKPTPTSRFVTLIRPYTNDYFIICELSVYGDCLDGEFGPDCTHRCHCEGKPCNKTTGVCPSGKCLPWFTGGTCSIVLGTMTEGNARNLTLLIILLISFLVTVMLFISIRVKRRRARNPEGEEHRSTTNTVSTISSLDRAEERQSIRVPSVKYENTGTLNINQNAVKMVTETRTTEEDETVTETSSNVMDIIQGIKFEEKAIQAVGACFNPESNKYDITFVSKQPNEVRNHIEKMMSERSSELPGYNLEVRNVSEEGMAVTHSNEFIGFFDEDSFSRDIFELQEVISKHSVTIFKSSPNITSVSFSPVKSTGYGTSSHVILKEACIAIFVKVKFDNKRIPLGAKRIPEFIDGIKTDVREGFVETLMQAPENALNVGSGCLISRSNEGTLGPFMCSKRGITGFLTSLHVLLSSEEIRTATFMSPCRSEVFHKSVYKAKGHNREMGKLMAVYYSEGNYSKSGFEFGLIELSSNVDVIEDTIQTSGLAGYRGETTAITRQNYRNILEKIGAKTGLTQGIFKGFHSIRLEYDETTGRSFILFCQIGLLGAHHETDNDGKFIPKDFAERGDSGSLVTISEGDTDKVVGILTGRRSDDMYMATPIQPICDCLHMDGWKICTPQNHNNNCEQRMDIDSS